MSIVYAALCPTYVQHLSENQRKTSHKTFVLHYIVHSNNLRFFRQHILQTRCFSCIVGSFSLDTDSWCLWVTERLVGVTGVEDAAVSLTFHVGFGTCNNGLRQFILNMFDTIFPGLFCWQEAREEALNHTMWSVRCLLHAFTFKDQKWFLCCI